MREKKTNSANGTFEMNISDIQPTQLYISEEKIASIMEWLKKENDYIYDPIPIKKLNGNIIYVDGHTRATALFKLGYDKIMVKWEPDEWDWEAYQICVDWCIDESINTIKDLSDRVINKDEYELLWHDRCRVMQNNLKEKREIRC